MDTPTQRTQGTPMEPAMQLALDANFGSVEGWRRDAAACADAHAGDAGRLQLVFQPHEGSLANRWSASATPVAADRVPILELAPPGSSGVVLADIDWAATYARYQAAVVAASEAWGATQDQLDGAQLLDVRRAGVFAQAGQMIPGARWCDPAQVAQWAGGMAAGGDVVVYCVYGHEVGRATALRLRAAGLNARYLQGGIDAWKASGRPLTNKPAP